MASSNCLRAPTRTAARRAVERCRRAMIAVRRPTRRHAVVGLPVVVFRRAVFGSHNFYLKRTGVAVTQLILSLTIVGIAGHGHLASWSMLF